MRHWLARSGMALERALSARPRLQFAALAGGGTTLIGLFLIRVSSGAEFAFASLALLAAAIWFAADLASDREFS